MELSLEQQFELRRFTGVVEVLSREQAQQQLIKLYEQYLLTTNRPPKLSERLQ